MEFKRLRCLYLDILSIPGWLMSKRGNAAWHLKYVCPRCPPWRKKMRHVEGVPGCYWHNQWMKKDYGIPKHFGLRNWFFQIFLLRTDFSKRMRASRF